MEKEMFERLEGLHSIDGVKNMLAHFEYVVRDIQDHEPFEVSDIIEYLTIKMESKAAKLEL